MSSTQHVSSLSTFPKNPYSATAIGDPTEKLLDLGERPGNSDAVNIDLSDVYKGLTVLGQKVVSKLDEILAESGAGPVSSLDPEEHTPEKTADRIVNGVLGLIEAYARQNPELEDEDMLESFMGEVRKGIKQGYEEAVGILEAIGAFEIDGVREGIEETMRLVEEKLVDFEKQFLASRKEAPEEDIEQGSAETDASAKDVRLAVAA